MKRRGVFGVGALILATAFLDQGVATAAVARASTLSTLDTFGASCPSGEFEPATNLTAQVAGLVEVCRDTLDNEMSFTLASTAVVDLIPSQGSPVELSYRLPTEPTFTETVEDAALTTSRLGSITSSSECPYSSTHSAYRLVPGATVIFGSSQGNFSICSVVDTEATTASFAASGLAERLAERALPSDSLISNAEQCADGIGYLNRNSPSADWQATAAEGFSTVSSCRSVGKKVFRKEKAPTEATKLEKLSESELDLPNTDLAKLAEDGGKGSVLDEILDFGFKVVEVH
jgi:hypothetical protein